MKKRGLKKCRKCKDKFPNEDYIVGKKTSMLCKGCRYDSERKRTLRHYKEIAEMKGLPKCIMCEIILTDEVCRCGLQHGLPSEDPTICEKCYNKIKKI